MEKTVKIYYCGHDLVVDGVYEEGEKGGWDCPGSASEFEINYIHLGQHEVSDLLADQFSEIEKVVIDKIEGR
jgi:hypothetical protein